VLSLPGCSSLTHLGLVRSEHLFDLGLDGGEDRPELSSHVVLGSRPKLASSLGALVLIGILGPSGDTLIHVLVKRVEEWLEALPCISMDSLHGGKEVIGILWSWSIVSKFGGHCSSQKAEENN